VPALSFPVPQYTILTLLTDVSTRRRLDDNSPGGTDNTATVTPSVSLLTPFAGYLTPQGTAQSSALLSSGNAFGRGWGIVPQDAGLVGSAADGFSIAAGTLTMVIHASRAGGLLTGNHTAAFTVIVFRANSDATSFPQELGRATVTGRSITTSETTHTVNVSLSAAEFAPGEILWVEIHVDHTSAGTAGDAARFHTNSTSATRITAAPNYTINRMTQFTSAGEASAAALGAATASGTFNAAGSGEAQAVGAATFSGVFSGAGEASSGVVSGLVLGASFAATGATDSDWRQTGIFSGAFSAAGSAEVEAVGNSIFAGVFDAEGSSDADYRGSSVAGAVFSASGEAATDIRTSVVLGAVFEADVGEGGGENVIINKRLLIVDEG
jgi:hypothetical protein